MAEVAFADDPVNADSRKSKYNATRDRERMKIYMKNQRDMRKVGFLGTVKQWINAGKPGHTP